MAGKVKASRRGELCVVSPVLTGRYPKRKSPDLVGVTGDPLSDIKVLGAPDFVMHEGRIVVQK